MNTRSSVTIHDPGAETIDRYTNQIISSLTQGGRRVTARVEEEPNPGLIRSAVHQAFYAGVRAEADAREGGASETTARAALDQILDWFRNRDDRDMPLGDGMLLAKIERLAFYTTHPHTEDPHNPKEVR